MKKSNESKVYLVGAGPGDPDLLTVKARRLLIECDVLIYDALIPKDFLELTSNKCRHIFVGKRRGNHSMAQDEINRFLVDFSKKHYCIVRLKGGDPFLFGRGAEEAEWLVRHNINVEIVPGITSGMAAPAYMGIPLTHRKAASSVTFVTGHDGINKKDTSVNWRALAKGTDGIVIYMGMHNLEYIINELIAGGLDPKTPSAIIEKGTSVHQKQIKAPLNKLIRKNKSSGLSSPSIIIIGKVIDYQIEECSPAPGNLTVSKLNNVINLQRTFKRNKFEHVTNK